MKAIPTVLFLACIAAALAISLLIVPEAARDDRFWLNTGAIILALGLMYLALVLLPRIGGVQGHNVLRFQSTAGSAVYLLAVLSLATLSATGISFRWLLVLHILALLVWLLVIGLGAIGSEAMKRADELEK